MEEVGVGVSGAGFSGSFFGDAATGSFGLLFGAGGFTGKASSKRGSGGFGGSKVSVGFTGVTCVSRKLS